MYSKYRNWITPSLLALWLIATCTGASAHEVAKHELEALQKVQIAVALDHSDYLYGNEIRIAVYEGKATLSGKVESAVNRDLAKQIALGVNGITTVDNRLAVDAAYRSPRLVSQRSYNEMAAQTISAYASLPPSEASVANSATGKSASSQQAGWGADAWVTVRVKFAFIYSGTIDSGSISVNTNNGIVTLKGRVAGGAERELAIEQAGNVSGVKGVDTTGFGADTEADEILAAS